MYTEDSKDGKYRKTGNILYEYNAEQRAFIMVMGFSRSMTLRAMIRKYEA